MSLRIKCRPEDFCVEELTTVSCQGGPHAFYRLRKQSLGTPEAVDAICRKWSVRREQVGLGGLKDRHADTIQYLTIFRGPRKRLRQTNLELEYVGQFERPYGPELMAGNRFAVTVRDVRPAFHDALDAALQEARQAGWPNYFDDQRFGSLGASGQFIAEPWCRGDYERALWLALADENSHDSAGEKRDKQLLRDQWGQWPALREELARSPRRNIVTFLADHPRDFRRALAMISVDLRRLYLAAFQSYLWNELLSAYLQSALSRSSWQTVQIGPSAAALPTRWHPDELQAADAVELPLPTARDKQLPEPAAGLLDAVLKGRGLELRELRVKYPRDSFFSKGLRPLRVVPGKLEWSAGADELYPGQEQWRLEFELPRGAYATLLVKYLGLASQPPAAESEPESDDLP